MTGLLLAASALVPAFLLLWYLYSRDRNPEPKGMIAKTFLLGAVIVVPVIPCALALEALGRGLGGVWGVAFVSAFLGAAIPEESFKLLVLRGWAYGKPAFDEPMDGMVYGAAASLGFAAFENVRYVGQHGLGIAALRAFTAVPGHALTGVIMGAYVGKAKFGQAGATVAKGLLAAVLLHGLYDLFLFTQSGFALLSLLVLVVEVVWARRLVRSMRDEQQVVLPTVLAPAAGPVAAAAVAGPPAVVAALPGAPWPRPAAASVPQQPSPGAGWTVFRILAGGAGASLGSLLILLMMAVALEGGSELSVGDAVIASAVVGVPTVLFLLLFAWGIRGLPSNSRQRA